MRIECHDVCEDAAEREDLSRFTQRVDKRIIPGGAISDVDEDAMQFGIGLFKPLQHRLRGALRWSLSKSRQIVNVGGHDVLAADRNEVTLKRESIAVDLRRVRELSQHLPAADQAYQLQDFQITGGPSWLASDHFDINAKVPDEFRGMAPQAPGSGPGPLQLMIRALLVERFKLVDGGSVNQIDVNASLAPPGFRRIFSTTK